MILLPDFSKCIDFQRLREKMGVTIIPHVPRVRFTRKITKQKEIIEPNTETIQIENKLKKDSIDVISTDIIPDKIRDKILEKIPLGRFGETADIANLALYMASDESSYVTGQVISINGGYYI